MKTTRRDFIAHSAMTTAALLSGFSAKGKSISSGVTNEIAHTKADSDFKLSIFSKNLQWLDYNGMASTAADLGFDGVDLTVRPGGHVLPERVAEDLPKAFEAVKKAGLHIYSIVTAIENADDPLTENILKTASGLGISFYRMGWLHYDEKKSIEENLKEISANLKNLDALNKKYKMQCGYQNHAGPYFGAAVWDLSQVLKEINAQWTGFQYDIYHATIEGANSWVYGLKLIRPYVKTINIKDYEWTKKNGKWTTESVPLGEGAVDFKKYFNTLKDLNIKCPISLHYEYPLGTADQGGKVLTIDKQIVLDAMKKDLAFLKRTLTETGLTG